MRAFMLLIFIVVMCLLYAMPMYIIGNIIFIVFNSAYRLTIFQAFVISVLITMIFNIFSKDEEGHD